MEKPHHEITVADQIKQSLQQVTATESYNYDHIHLDTEEIEAWTKWALNKARKAKAAKLAEIEYAQRVNNPKKYSELTYEQLRSYVLSRHPKFILDDDNREIFELLCQYFSHDPAFEFSEEYSFEKGIMLTGPVGCGKTSLMKMFGINSYRPFATTPCRVIADAYQIEGAESLYKYSTLMPVFKELNYGHSEIGHCYDDLGTEDDKKNFGNQVNVMQDIIFKVYDNNLIGQVHATTNLGVQDIENQYGSRVRSRLREMFNQITFDPNATDRRK